VTRIRAFRNSDPPALARLWNLAVPNTLDARPLRVHELDTHAWGTVNFEHSGLLVAERDGRIIGFVHAGFGPALPVNSARPLENSHDMGTVAMLVTEQGLDDPVVASDLIRAAEDYLQARGAKVFYAGGLFPLNPFYWGISGGSEGAGVLSRHEPFRSALVELGYEPVSATILLEADLSIVDPRDPRAALIRRQTQLDFEEDASSQNWWQNLALGDFPLMRARLVSRSSGEPIACAETWDMAWFGRSDGRSRMGLLNVEVGVEHRRKGYARHLITEILRRARANLVALVEVQASATNQPALSLYASLGFQPIDEATLFRLPAYRGR
jgi:ribosomal protein S18 acetylase RimI-like enzyme